LEGKRFADLVPPAPPKRGQGMPQTPFRKIVQTLLDVLITGCRWGALPRGAPWASKRAAHRW
jgi:transposase